MWAMFSLLFVASQGLAAEPAITAKHKEPAVVPPAATVEASGSKTPAVSTEAAVALPQDQKMRAVQALERAVKADIDNPELWLHLGFSYRKVEKLDWAQQAFEKVISLDPKNDDALFMLGLIYEKGKRTQDAQRVWKQYLTDVSDPEKRRMAEKHIHHLSR